MKPSDKTQVEGQKSFHAKSMEGPSAAEVKATMEKHEGVIAEIVGRYPEPRAALLPILHLMQCEFGWLPPIIQKAIANRLKIAPAEVFRVVQFYTLYRGKKCGKHVLMVCGTLSCALAGANKVLKTLQEELGVKLNETTSDGKFTIERVECLGWCDKAPVVQVNESDFIEKVTPDMARDLVRSLRDV